MSEPRQPKTRYKTTNWAAYNAALKVRWAHSVKRPRNRWAKNYTEQGQGHCSIGLILHDYDLFSRSTGHNP